MEDITEVMEDITEEIMEEVMEEVTTMEAVTAVVLDAGLLITIIDDLYQICFINILCKLKLLCSSKFLTIIKCFYFSPEVQALKGSTRN